MLTGEQEKNQDHDHRVPKVQNGACNACDFKSGKEIVNCISKKINNAIKI